MIPYKKNKKIIYTLKRSRLHIKFTIYNYKNENDFVLSAAFFMLEKNDKINTSKDQKTKNYLTSLHKQLEILDKTFKKYTYRIYCDSISFQSIAHLLNHKAIEIFVYELPLLGRDPCYYGYIGTLIRFLPLFSLTPFDRWIKKVVILDLDIELKPMYIEMMKYDLVKHSFIFPQMACYGLNERFKAMGVLSLPMIVYFICLNKTKCVLPNYLLFDFFNQCLFPPKLTSSPNHYVAYLNRLKLSKVFNTMNYHKTLAINKEKNKLMYGIDEYFLNYYLISHFNHSKKKITMIQFNYSKKDLIQLLTKIKPLTKDPLFELFVNQQQKLYYLQQLKRRYNLEAQDIDLLYHSYFKNETLAKYTKYKLIRFYYTQYTNHFY